MRKLAVCCPPPLGFLKFNVDVVARGCQGWQVLEECLRMILIFSKSVGFKESNET